MNEATPVERERAALRDLLALTADRARTEAQFTATFTSRRVALEKTSKQERAHLEGQHLMEKSAAESELNQARRDIPATRERLTNEQRTRAETARRQVLSHFKETKKEIDSEMDQARWEAATVFEAGKSDSDTNSKQLLARIATENANIDTLYEALDQYLVRNRMKKLEEEYQPAPLSGDGGADPIATLSETNVHAGELLARLQGLMVPRLIQGGLTFILCLLVFLGAAIPAFLIVSKGLAILLGLLATATLGIGATVGLKMLATNHVRARYPELVDTLARAEGLAEQSKQWVTEREKQIVTEMKDRQYQEVRRAERKAASRTIEIEAWRDTELTRLGSESAEGLAGIQARHKTMLERAEAEGTKQLAEIEGRFQRDIAAFEERDRDRRQKFDEEVERAWADLAQRWREGIARWNAETAALDAECRRLFLDWSAPEVSYAPPAEVAPSMKIGQLALQRSQIPGGLPRDERLTDDGREHYTLPALLAFPEAGGSLVLEARNEGREAAISVVQAAMLRLLTSTPPGKVRFTIIDPVGLGQNFAAYMHLADYDEQLVTSRIWTEPTHIEKRLADLTEHMEKVIQKYLRNEYNSIQEYNAVAGEVAEPFRVLVVANFPANFTEQAARRLVSIAQSGPKCGVYVLMTIDEREQLPPGCTVPDLEKPSTVMAWKQGKFVWTDPDFGVYPLTLDQPPSDEVLTRLLHEVGTAAKDATRVEVPFEVVAPTEDAYWTDNSAEGVSVPLGRVGATKFQDLRLGRGTSQHALLAGRTGSGKSTLLHALITNAALRYSPDQIELYLIDFKKGVEFKTYAAHRLPHARVIAIESEREFGLSVLQRLDAELKVRGDLYRDAGAQDLAGFREARPDHVLPRVMLIVDEFQEFFVDDDKLAQEAALLLDRLVRQGRAFGIHALLGSQTLGGAFSLARSTLGQMAVRIALQCSEADAHLILSEDNGAARLLSRPGEAIYNDANGMIEGNHFFQVVWLNEDRRDEYLHQITELDHRNGPPPPRQQIVFEGNIAADIDQNHLLRQAIMGTEPGSVPRAPTAWLGDAVAIKDPTAAVFRRQSGANLLIVGQNDESAIGIAQAAMAGLAAQYPTENGNGSPPLRFFVLDGTPDDAPLDGVLDKMADIFPHPTRICSWRDTADVINEIATEVARRQADRLFDEGSIFLIVHDVPRFRDLRKSDDDYGFSRGDGESRPSPSKQFGDILREGPGVGIHTIVWCDSLNNLNRTFDRSSLREFEMRVLFQMSPNDSSSLIDTPVAGRLGMHRAFFASEEEGRLEKFRPYGLPSDEWWARVREQLRARRGVVPVV